jgi:acetolactate synthase-1/2/3 large subunit
VILLGGGVSRRAAAEHMGALRFLGVPIMTTWNGADRFDASEPLYFGRPNTWGQRHANIIINQADCIVALGTRLGLQQTGFNWQEFGRHATVVQVDLDPAELTKGHPKVDIAVAGDADTMLREIVIGAYPDCLDWIAFCDEVKTLVPLDDPQNLTRPGFVSPYAFYLALSAALTPEDVVIPCSSGGANSTALQTIEQKFGQIMITDKGLASMGVGLSGAIGAALAHPQRRTVLVEGDGGFIQNLQELATVGVNDLTIKIFIFANDGYGSIRMTQKNYFDGAYLGCDTQTGLGFPKWAKLFDAFDIPLIDLDERGLDTPGARAAFDAPGAHAFIVPIDPEQTYYPKITSRITATGSMESQPLHLMSPPLPDAVAARVFPYLRLEPLAR